MDRGDHNPLWWTRSVQDRRGPTADIFLIGCLQASGVGPGNGGCQALVAWGDVLALHQGTECGGEEERGVP